MEITMDNEYKIDDEAMGLSTSDPYVEKFEKQMQKVSVDDALATYNRGMEAANAQYIGNVRTALEDSNYAELLEQTDLSEWESSAFADPAAYDEYARMVERTRAELEELESKGMIDWAASTITDLDSDAPGILPPALINVGIDGKKRLTAHQTDYLSDARQRTREETPFFGLTGDAATAQAQNFIPDRATAELLETYSDYEGYGNLAERFSDTNLDTSMIEDLGSIILDLGRVFYGGQRVLFNGSLSDTEMDRAIKLDDAAFQRWGTYMADNIDELVQYPDTDPSGNLKGLSVLVSQYGKDTMEKLLRNAKNADALTVSLNKLANDARMMGVNAVRPISLSEKAGVMGTALVNDPSLMLDLGAGALMMGFGAATGVAPVGAAGAAVATVRIGTRIGFISKSATKLKRAMDVGRSISGFAGHYAQKAGRVVTLMGKALPSQVFSEVVFPSLQYGIRAAKARKADDIADAAARGYRNYIDFIINDSQYVGKGAKGRALQAAWQNGLEGGIQGFADYVVMYNNERILMEATYGKEAADQMQFDMSGAMAMAGMGFGMGGVLGMGMRSAFEQVGKLNMTGAAKQWDNALTRKLATFGGEAVEMWNSFNHIRRKQALLKKMKGTGEVDEAALDTAIDSRLALLSAKGYDVDRAVKLTDVVLREDGELDVEATIKAVEEAAFLQTRYVTELTGAPARLAPDAVDRVMSTRRANLNEEQLKQIEDHPEVTIEEAQASLPSAPVEELSPDAAARQETARKAAEQSKERLEALKKDAQNLQEKGASKKKVRTARRAVELQTQKHARVQQRLDNVNNEIRSRQESAMIQDLAENEILYFARLKQLAEKDIDGRLKEGGKVVSTEDVALGNIWTLFAHKAEAGEDEVSTTALLSRFTQDELHAIVIDGRTLSSILTSRASMSLEDAKALVVEARKQALARTADANYETTLIELEELGRRLGSDDDAAQILAQAAALQKVKQQTRVAASNDTETSGLSAEAREALFAELPEDSDDIVAIKKQVEDRIDEKADEIRELTVQRRIANDRRINDMEQLDTDGTKKAIEERKEKIRKEVNKNWPSMRKTLVSNVMAEYSVRFRPSSEHVRPVMTIINRLRLEASKSEGARADEAGDIRFFLYRNQLLAAMPMEYRFIINTLDSAMDADGRYDLDKVINLLLVRVARADADLGFLLRAGAESRADLMRTRDDLESIELTEEHQDMLMMARAQLAKEEFEASGGLYAGGTDKGGWESEFAANFNERTLRNIMKNPAHLRAVAAEYGIIIPDGEDLTIQKIRDYARQIYRAAGTMEEFSDFGGGDKARDYITGREAAFMVIESLETPARARRAMQQENQLTLDETTGKIKRSDRPDIERRVERAGTGDEPYRKRLGLIQDNTQRKLFERTRTNKRLKYLLFDEEGKPRSDEDVEAIYDWLKSLDESDVSDPSAMGESMDNRSFRFAPPEWEALTDKMPRSPEEYVDGVVRNLMTVPPAAMATIHDAVDVAIGGQLGALNPALDGVSESGFASAQGAFGLGFGFRTLMAAPGSTADNLNIAWEMTVGVEGLAQKAREAHGDALSGHLVRLGLLTEGEELSDATILGAITRGMMDDSKRAEVAELFLPDAKYLDADAQGANILMSAVRLQDMRRALKSDDTIADIAEKEATGYLGREEFSTDEAADLYGETQRLVREVIEDDNKLAALLNEMGMNLTPEELDMFRRAFKVWQAILDEFSPEELRDSLFKAPVMTDLYQIGLEKMTDNMVADLFLGGKLTDSQAERLNRIIAEQGFTASDGASGVNLGVNVDARHLAGALTNLLHSNNAKIQKSMIKKAVFGDENITNADIGRALIRLRKQQFNGSDLDPSTVTMSPLKARSMAMEALGLSGIEELTPGQRSAVDMQTMILLRAAQEANPGRMSKMDNPERAMQAAHDELVEKIDKATAGIDDPAEKLIEARRILQAERAQNDARARAYAALANQNFHVDEADMTNIMAMIIGREGAEAVMKEATPQARHAMANGFFRNLAISNEGRIFVNTLLDMTQDKTMRIGSEDSPLGAVRFYDSDGTGMTAAKARRGAIMQMASQAVELTGQLPKLSGAEHVDMDMVEFLRDWRRLDKIRDEALKGTTTHFNPREAVRQYLVGKGFPEDDQLEGLIDDTLKILKKVRNNALTGRSDDATFAAGDDVVRMSGFGMADPRMNMDYTDAVGMPAASRVQSAPKFARLRRLRDVEAVAEGEGSGAMFSAEEMNRPVDASDMAVPAMSLDQMDEELTFATNLGVGPEAGLRYRMAVMTTTLNRFADEVGTPYAKRLKEKGRYDKLYVLYNETMAHRDEYSRLAQLSTREVGHLQAYGRDLVNNTQSKDGHEGKNIRFRARLSGRRAVDRHAQWAHDLENTENSMLKLEGDPHTRSLVTAGDTMAESISATAADNPTGPMMAWLFEPASQPGILLARSGNFRYSDNYDSSRSPVFAQMSDSQIIFGAALADAYQYKMIAQRLGLTDMDAEGYRQLRVAISQSSGVMNPDMSNFRSDIQELFSPGNIDSTFATIDAARGAARAEMKSDSFVSDLGATGEGRMLFRAQFSDDDMAKIKSDLERRGLEWSDVEDKLFTTTVGEQANQKPQVFTNFFGEQIAPHKFIGQGRVALTADSMVRAMNLVGNRRFTDRMRTGSALGLNRVAFEQEMSARMAGYDGNYGDTIKSVRRRAAMEAETVEAIMQVNGTKKIKDSFVQELGSSARFLNFGRLTDDELRGEAKRTAAIATWRSLAPTHDDAFGTTHAQVLKRLIKGDSPELVDAIFLSHVDGELDFDGVYAVLKLDYYGKLDEAAIREHVDKVMVEMDNIREVLNHARQNNAANMKASADADTNAANVRENTSATDRATRAEDGFSDISETRDDLSATDRDLHAEKLQRRGNPEVYRDPASSLEDAAADPAIRTEQLDRGLDHKFSRRLPNKGGAYDQANAVLAKLEQNKTITKEERLLLDSVFADMDESLLANMFAGTELQLTAPGSVPGRASAYVSADTVVQRIEMAKRLHEEVNPGTPFGAAGVLLEEVGHLIDLRMRAANPTLWKQGLGAYMDRYGDRLDPMFREIFGKIGETDLGEGIARGFAAVMLSDAATRLLRKAPAELKQWFSAASIESLKRMSALSDHAAMRSFRTDIYDDMVYFLHSHSPVDVMDKLRSGLIRRGHVDEDSGWHRHHVEPLEQAKQEIHDKYVDDSGMLDGVALKQDYRSSQQMQDDIVYNHVQQRLEMLGSGAEVVSAYGQLVLKALGNRIGRSVNQFMKATMAPTATINVGLDKLHGERLPVMMRGLLSMLAPNEFLSSGQFSTFNNQSAPTLQTVMVELNSRFGVPMEQLYLMQMGRNDLSGNMKGNDLEAAVYRSLMNGDDDSYFDNLGSEADIALALNLRDQIRRTLRLTANDMLAAGMLKTEAEAAEWSSGVPLRFSREAMNGEGRENAAQHLTDAYRSSMKSSDIIDVDALLFMKDPAGRPLLKDTPYTADELADLRDAGLGEFADLVDKLQKRGLNPELNYRDGLMADLNAEVREGRLTMRDLGPEFRQAYDNALSDEITGEGMALRAAELVPDKSTTTLSRGYAGIRAEKKIAQLGSSAYISYSDPFIKAADFLDGPLSEFMETSLMQILRGVQKGPAASAMDKALYGKMFGVKGFGLEDAVDMLLRQTDPVTGRKYSFIDPETGEGQLDAMDSMSTAEATFAKKVLFHIKKAIKYSKGTLDRQDMVNHESDFFRIFTDLMSVAVSASIAPKYILGSMVEEVPQQMVKAYGKYYAGVRGEVEGLFSQATTRAERAEVLRAVGAGLRDLHENSSISVRIGGVDESQFLDAGLSPSRIKELNRRITQFAGLGFKTLNQKLQTIDILEGVSRIKTLVLNSDRVNGVSLFDVLSDDIRRGTYTNMTNDELNAHLRKQGVPSAMLVAVRDYIRAGFFDPATADATKKLIADFFPTDSNKPPVWTDIEDYILSMPDPEMRRIYNDASMSLRVMLELDRRRTAKEATVATANIQGTSIERLMQKVSSYSQMVGQSLRNIGLASTSQFAAQAALYMISGYLYYKASQFARGASFDEAVIDSWQQNPEVEAYDAIMSVPFMGYAQMSISFIIKQAILGGLFGQEQFSSQGGQAFQIPALGIGNSNVNAIAAGMDALRRTLMGPEAGDWESFNKKDVTNLVSRVPAPGSFILAPMVAEMDQMLRDAILMKDGHRVAGKRDGLSGAEQLYTYGRILSQGADPAAQGSRNLDRGTKRQREDELASVREQALDTASAPVDPSTVPPAAAPAAPAPEEEPPSTEGPLKAPKSLDAPDSLK